MKIREVCERTGLTERTIRFYMQKGLISPQSAPRNGRKYTEFTEADVEQLRAIATLRGFAFSLDEILTMQRTPESIPAIVATRREAALQAHQIAENTFTALERLDIAGVVSIADLADRARQAAAFQPHPAQPGSVDEINQSGMGDRCNTIPWEIEGKWNWGAFLFPVIWGLWNHVYQALLCFIPIFGFFYNFYLGSKGNRLAWKYRYWESVAHFQKVQRRWALVTGLLTIALVALNIGLHIAATQAAAQAEALREERLASFEKQLLSSPEWAAFTAGRTEWTQAMTDDAAQEEEHVHWIMNPTDAFYLDPTAYYRIRDAHYFDYGGAAATVADSGEIVFNESGAYMTFLCLVELSDGARWIFQCDGDESGNLRSIRPELDAEATAEGQAYVASVMQAAEDIRAYIAEKTREMTSDPLWQEKIGGDYVFIHGPFPGYLNYGPVYEGGRVECGGLYGKIQANGRSWYVEIPLESDENTGETIELPLTVTPAKNEPNK